MAVEKIDIVEFLQIAKVNPVIDARSPAEYEHAHFPGAFSIPIFSNEERKVVGTLYKQESREAAIKKGLEFFGVKMVKMVEEVEAIIRNFSKEPPSKKTVLVHCWRGGMRSGGVAWLLDLYGFKVYTLIGGYKAFRQWTLEQFDKEYPFKIIGGYTGSGKTLVLQEMKNKGLQVVDLEGLANHKGSAFGGIDMPAQPTQEMFENKLALELLNVSTSSDKPVYVEDESQRIGNKNIPPGIWKQMRSKEILFLDIPFEERLKHIVKDYGKGDKEKLVNAIIRIQKRLGGLETKTALNFLIEDNIGESFRVLLHYYDKLYKKGLQNRDNWQELVTEIECETVDAKVNAAKILMKEKETINV